MLAAVELAVAGVRVGSRNAGQFRRYGARDKDGDAEDERARTAHKLFADPADLKPHSGSYSPSRSLDDGPSSDGQEPKPSASPDTCVISGTTKYGQSQ